MNCPSRNDDVLLNPGWNQSPPRFAADLTTCEDLNGIANARELGEADRLCSGSRSLRQYELEDSNFKENENEPFAIGKGVKGSSKGNAHPDGCYNHGLLSKLRTGSCTQTIATMKYEHQARLNDWAKWILSVLITSTLVSYFTTNLPEVRHLRKYPYAQMPLVAGFRG
jgi:hypothetical protein